MSVAQRTPRNTDSFQYPDFVPLCQDSPVNPCFNESTFLLETELGNEERFCFELPLNCCVYLSMVKPRAMLICSKARISLSVVIVFLDQVVYVILHNDVGSNRPHRIIHSRWPFSRNVDDVSHHTARHVSTDLDRIRDPAFPDVSWFTVYQLSFLQDDVCRRNHAVSNL